MYWSWSSFLLPSSICVYPPMDDDDHHQNEKTSGPATTMWKRCALMRYANNSASPREQTILCSNRLLLFNNVKTKKLLLFRKGERRQQQLRPPSSSCLCFTLPPFNVKHKPLRVVFLTPPNILTLENFLQPAAQKMGKGEKKASNWKLFLRRQSKRKKWGERLWSISSAKMKKSQLTRITLFFLCCLNKKGSSQLSKKRIHIICAIC